MLLNILEISYSVLNKAGKERADIVLEALWPLVAEPTKETIKRAMAFRSQNKKHELSYADCPGYSKSPAVSIIKEICYYPKPSTEKDKEFLFSLPAALLFFFIGQELLVEAYHEGVSQTAEAPFYLIKASAYFCCFPFTLDEVNLEVIIDQAVCFYLRHDESPPTFVFPP